MRSQLGLNGFTYCTVTVLVQVLFTRIGSGMKLLIELAWVICVPGATDELTLTVRVTFTALPDGSSYAEQEIAPAENTDGF